MKPFSYLSDPWREGESLEEMWDRALNDPVFVLMWVPLLIIAGFAVGILIGK